MIQRRYRWLAAALAAVTVAAGVGVVVRAAARSADQVSVLASWTGAEEAAFRRVLTRFTELHGIEVSYQGTRALSQVLVASVRDGSAPDVAILPNPGELASYARQELLYPLDEVLDVSDGAAEGPRWLRLDSGERTKVYAVAIKADIKGLIWYHDRDLVGPEPPQTWDDLHTLRDAVPGGGSLWCLGMASTPASGWPGTDWIENILLRRSGAETYQQWASGALEWTSPEVIGAWEAWGELLGGSVYGGPLTAVLTEFTASGRPMFTDPPGCYLDHQASFMAGVYEGFESAPKRGTDFEFFRFPPVSGAEPLGDSPAVVSADLAGVFSDTPQARELVRFLASEEAWWEWADGGSDSVFTLTSSIDPGAYQDPADGEIARVLATAPLCFDASDLMPATMTNAFHHAVLEYLHDPLRLESIIENLEAVRLSIDQEQWLEMSCDGS